MSFRNLHRPGDPFIMPNAWDAGSAKMLTALGAKAIATSSGAYAFSKGLPDAGLVSRDDSLAHAQEILAAVRVPVSGDFEDGFGPDPDDCAETVRLAGEIGLAGICIEDVIGASEKVYPFDLAVERIKAASAAARALPHDFFFVARADGVMTKGYDLEEALRRIRAFDAAGADGLYVPKPGGLAGLKQVVAATSKPVNALVNKPYAQYSLAEFAACGVARISLGASLARVTHQVIHDAGRAMLAEGDFTGLADAMPATVSEALLKEGGA
jgi:2-methylisocitrate lyase-like PEP mutase family enzyme